MMKKNTDPVSKLPSIHEIPPYAGKNQRTPIQVMPSPNEDSTNLNPPKKEIRCPQLKNKKHITSSKLSDPNSLEQENHTNSSCQIHCYPLILKLKRQVSGDISVNITGPLKFQRLINDDFKFCIQVLKRIDWELLKLINGKEISCVFNNLLSWKKRGSNVEKIIKVVNKKFTEFDFSLTQRFYDWPT